MWHLFRNKQKQFEFAFISKGRYIAGTKQGYENRSDALSALNFLVRKPMPGGSFYAILVQDNTGEKPVVIALYTQGKQVLTNNKPAAPYS
jgi:uncharacterized protein YegP (UPF0339 family)